MRKTECYKKTSNGYTFSTEEGEIDLYDSSHELMILTKQDLLDMLKMLEESENG